MIGNSGVTLAYQRVLQAIKFSDVVEAIKELSTQEKEEIQMLLQQYLCEERREEIYNNFKAAQQEEQNGELKFYPSINELRKVIEE